MVEAETATAAVELASVRIFGSLAAMAWHDQLIRQHRE